VSNFVLPFVLWVVVKVVWDCFRGCFVGFVSCGGGCFVGCWVLGVVDCFTRWQWIVIDGGSDLL